MVVAMYLPTAILRDPFVKYTFIVTVVMHSRTTWLINEGQP